MKTLYIAQYLLIVLLFGVWSAAPCCAQDLHYSQFEAAPLSLLPTDAGVGEPQKRFTANAREQWQSVPVPYLTFAAAYDQRTRLNTRNMLGLGIALEHDMAGDGQLTHTAISITGAYHRRIARYHWLSFGAAIGMVQRGIVTSRLTFDNQFDGDSYNASIAPNENYNMNPYLYPDLRLSAAWHYEQGGWQAQFGIGVAHPHRPLQGFESAATTTPLERKYSAFAAATIPISQGSNDNELLPVALIQRQGSYTETVLGVSFRHRFYTEVFHRLAADIGVRVRLGDAIIPTFAVQYNQWRAGVSYDLNNSPFVVATSGRGGMEVSLQYGIYEVPKLKGVKICPVF